MVRKKRKMKFSNAQKRSYFRGFYKGKLFGKKRVSYKRSKAGKMIKKYGSMKNYLSAVKKKRQTRMKFL